MMFAKNIHVFDRLLGLLIIHFSSTELLDARLFEYRDYLILKIVNMLSPIALVLLLHY